ncbi:ATP-dependent DNA helicase RecG [Aquaspirillum serpens]|uniref:ATP-dependent DNA helicase RecG n=1 Tax=Aquaspirillum serpens TaxID=190 RepID=UPI0004091A2E|nr:ATP-dependent DNA helicase RecG [Aquaspirillum serpens]
MVLSPAIEKKISKLGIQQPSDWLLHLPLRYEDETQCFAIAQAPLAQSVMVEGIVQHCEVKQRGGRGQLRAVIADASGQLVLRFIHFYPSQIKQCSVGHRLRVFGEIRLNFFGEAEMVHPKCRVVASNTPLSTHLSPVYPATQGITQLQLRKWIDAALAQTPLDDTLPPAMVQTLGLPSFSEAVLTLHHPPAGSEVAVLQSPQFPPWQRIYFDELLAQQLSMRLAYRARQRKAAPILQGNGRFTSALLQQLPFALTAAQQRVWQEIQQDLQGGQPMHRLLQGDVGAGKTVIAALSALDAIEAGYQAALMAPTEILAEQHYLKLRQWWESLGLTVVWLSGSLKKSQRQAALKQIANGEASLAVGTHALFQEDVAFARLGLTIVDEQHRFGVAQRLALQAKGGETHQLMMSATPIPRTLAMSYYADLDVSVIDELPPGRTPIRTRLIAAKRRPEVMAAIAREIEQGRQAYWVCPLIEESETLELQTAVATQQELILALPQLTIGLVHGKMKADEKAAVMAAFLANEIHLLVATTVIEVGVDVPNATLMIIEHAERMGLAQLHQLRGRVGRGRHASSCVLLFEEPLSELARARLRVIYEHTDGFEIARQDLLIRGPGEFLGAKQSGTPMLRFADIERDVALLEQARQWAPCLLKQWPDAARAHLARWLGGREHFLQA